MSNETSSADMTPAVSSTGSPAAPQIPAPLAVETLQPIYANFVRVGGSPEELVLDFGLNPNPFGAPAVPVTISERIVLNYYTAKRLLMALNVAVQRHEQAFGVLEIDVNKRVIPQVQRPSK